MTHQICALTSADADRAMPLYRDLVGTAPLADAARFANVLAHPGTRIFAVEIGDRLGAMATLHVLPNMTQGGRPYALIENVVTAADLRGRGLGRAVMQATIEAAWAMDAYKVMLLTGRTAAAQGFYERLGFSAEEKWGMSIRRAPLRTVG